MNSQRFSEREGLRYVPDALKYDDISAQALNGIYTEIAVTLRSSPILSVSAVRALHISACRACGVRFAPRSEIVFEASGILRDDVWPIISKAEWWQVLETIEEWFSALPIGAETRRAISSLSERINEVLKREGIGWEIKDRRIQRTQSPVLESRTREATLLLRDPKFQTAEQLWSKAVGALNRQPEPDIQNCIKDAVAAVEDMGNIVAATSGKPLDKLADELAAQSRIPKPLNNTLKPPFHYRGNEPGVAHGTGEISTARIEDAEYVLNWAAATIIYLSKV